MVQAREAFEERMKTTLIAATLNEIEAIQVVLPQIDKSWIDEIIITDGSSTDGTVEYCRENGYKVVQQKGKGYGSAIREVVKVARGDIIIEFPPDGNSLPEKIPEVIAAIEKGHDFVIVSRSKDGAKSHDDDFMTAIGNKLFTTLTNILFRTSYTDVLVGYRAYRKEYFHQLNLDADGLSWPLQEAIRFARSGVRVGEIPGDEPKRVGVQRKMRVFKTGWEILFVLIHEYRMMWNDKRKK
jgi:glycosyltransferase involved in cell wall biosynthesis